MGSEMCIRDSFCAHTLAAGIAVAACKSDVTGAISKVESEVLAGVLRIMKCSDSQVDTAGLQRDAMIRHA